MSRVIDKLPPPAIKPSVGERDAGVALFLVVTVCWMLGVASAEQGWISYEDVFLPIVGVVISAVSVVVTGYLLGRWVYALLFVWVPGVTMTAIGFSMDPTPGGDETGGGLIFLGPIVALFGGLYFLLLIALGLWLRGRRVKRLAPASDSIQPQQRPGIGRAQ